MMRKNRFLYAVLFGGCVFGAAVAVELTGTVTVNETSDTAAQAKAKAFNAAQRTVILRELRSYANPEQLTNAVQDSTSEDLMNMISSSSVASEKISDTTYSANVSFVIDGDAARRWMDEHSVQHWLPASESGMVVSANTVVMDATLLRPISDWMSLNAIARASGVDLVVRVISGNRVDFLIPESDGARFTNALRSAGWHVQQLGGIFKIWK